MKILLIVTRPGDAFHQLISLKTDYYGIPASWFEICNRIRMNKPLMALNPEKKDRYHLVREHNPSILSGLKRWLRVYFNQGKADVADPSKVY